MSVIENEFLQGSYERPPFTHSLKIENKKTGKMSEDFYTCSDALFLSYAIERQKELEKINEANATELKIIEINFLINNNVSK
jgi:hypothetical protein